MRNIPAPRQDLTFAQLKIYYQERGLELNNRFAQSLELLTPDGQYNYIAYLLADENGVSIKVAKYAGTDKVDLIENEEYGYCSLIKATNQVLEKMKIENVTKAKVTSTKRIEKNLIEPVPLREALINAVVHRLWKAFHNLCYAKLIVMQSHCRNHWFYGKSGSFYFA